MKKALITFSLIVIACSVALAEWASVPLEELVQDSDLIVVGTLHSVYKYSWWGTDYGRGTIQVEQVLWGNTQPSAQLRLTWDNDSSVVCPRVEHEGSGRGIWLLTLGKNGEVRADYPGRFVDLKERARVEKALAEKKVCVRPDWRGSSDGSLNVSFVFRNATPTEIAFPGMEYRDGYLWLSPEAKLRVFTDFLGKVNDIRIKPGRVISQAGLPPLIVGPQQEYRITVDFAQLCEFERQESFNLLFAVEGYGEGNKVMLSPPMKKAEFNFSFNFSQAAWLSLGVGLVASVFGTLSMKKIRQH